MQLCASDDFHILHREGERPTWKPGCRVGEDRIADMPSIWVGKVLRPLPIHTCVTSRCSETDERDVSSCVLANKVIVPIKAILYLTGRDDPIISTVRSDLLPTLVHVDDISILVSLAYIPRVLIVCVRTKIRAIVVHVSTEDAIGEMFGAHLAICFSLAEMMQVPRREKTMLMADDMVSDDIVGHTDCVDTDTFTGIGTLDDAARSLRATSAKRIMPPLTDDGVVADYVVHLVAILNVDADAAVLPQHVGIDQTFVSSMYGNTRLERVYHRVALKHTLLALPKHMEVQTVAANNAILATVLDASVANDADATLTHHHCGKTLASGVEAFVVPGDQNRSLHVYYFCSHLKIVTFDVSIATHAVVLQGGVDRQGG